MTTKTGTVQFNNMVDASHPITLTISSDTKVFTNPDGSKDYKLGETANSYNFDRKTGKTTIASSDIVVYEGTINQYMNDTKNTSNATAASFQTNTINNDQRIAAVAGHESVHGTDKQNQQQCMDNKLNGANNNVEAVPMQIEEKILTETGFNNNPLKNPKFKAPMPIPDRIK